MTDAYRGGSRELRPPKGEPSAVLPRTPRGPSGVATERAALTKSATIGVRCTPDDEWDIRAAAAAHGMSPGAWLLTCFTTVQALEAVQEAASQPRCPLHGDGLSCPPDHPRLPPMPWPFRDGTNS